MAGTPPHIAARRARSRAQLRRRRLLWIGGLVALAAGVVVVVIVASGGPGERTRSRSAITSSHAPHHPRRPPPASAVVARAEATGNATIRRLAQLGMPVYCAGRRGNLVAFTFDDGPGPYTGLALKKLARARQRATFFAQGTSIQSFPGWLTRERAVAALADHTFTHPVLPALPAERITSEIARTKRLIEGDTGQQVTLFRPPYGSRNPTVDQIARGLGLLEIIWDVDSRDSLGANWAGIIKNVEAGLHPGAIILMHENRGQTIRALTALLPELGRRHLRSVSLPELFASDPPSVDQLRQGPAGCGRGHG